MEKPKRLHEAGLARLVMALGLTRLSPNMLTICSLPPALLAGVAAALGLFRLAALLFLISGLLDLLDGAVARGSGRQTAYGALLDSSIDRLSDACIPVGLVFYYAPYGAVALLPVLALVPSLWISYIRARAQSLSLDLPRLWMRREDRFALLVAALLLAPWLGAWQGVPAMAVPVVLALIAGLGMVAGAMALVRARDLSQGR